MEQGGHVGRARSDGALLAEVGFFVVSTTARRHCGLSGGGTDTIWLKFLRDHTDAAWRMCWGWGKNGRRVETGG